MHGDEPPQSAPASPGQLQSHYAPHTPLSVHALEELIALSGGAGGGALLFFDGPSRDAVLAARCGSAGDALIRTLSETGNALEAASRLFELLHELDRAGLTCIFAQPAPEGGLGAAINDRLRRAAAKTRIA